MRIGFNLNLDLLSLHEPVWKVHSNVDQKRDKESEWFDHDIWIGFTNVHVIVRPMYGTASLEFNAANVRRPKSLFLLEPNDLSGVVEDVLEGLRHLLFAAFDSLDTKTGEIIRDPRWRSMVGFQRVDLAQNLLISSPHELALVKEAIMKATPRHMKKKELIESPKDGWTQYNKTRSSGLERIYDKHAQLANCHGSEQVPPGTLRFEAQLLGKRLKAPVYIKTLDQLTNETAWEILQHRWAACKWGVPIMEPNSIYDAISGESEAVQDSILGFMMKMADGLTAQIDPRRMKTMTQKAVSLGLVPGMPLQAQGLVSKVLDLESGGLVEIR